MNKKSLFATGALILSSAIAFAATPEGSTVDKQLQIYPKNLARQGVGTNVFAYDAAKATYVPTQAAAAWLDDDVVTGWPPAPGKSYYLVSLAQAQLVTNFAISAKAGSAGTVSLYASDTLAPPDAKGWAPLIKDINIEAINNKTMAKAFSRMTKYLLIETNIADPTPWYSIYIYGEAPATSYHLEKRAKPLADTTPLYGEYVNNGTMFNLSSLYADASVIYANSTANAVDLQKAIDDNPETSVTIAPSKTESGMIIRYSEPRQIQRISVMADPASKGRLDFFLVGSLPSGGQPATTQSKDDAQFMKVANTTPAAPADASGPVALDSLTPNATLVLDGSTGGRTYIDFPAVTASYMIVRWTPETEGQSISIGEINSFGDFSLADYQLVSDMAAIADGGAGDMSKEGDFKDGKDKNAIQPIQEGPTPGKDPFLPGGLGFPPNLTHEISP
ncbi:MAG TPA: hypothetical protein VG733_17140 [Chthoniobacteraceae bacterium]|nr:hypothetical protein [Chthoniobacteraceae bacterium]